MIAIIHPDLGIGGAERLIVDVAHSLLKAGKEIQLYTTHHNKRHCFPETLEEGDRARWIHVRSTWLPTAIFGYLHVVCVNIRCAWATLCMLWEVERLETVMIDQVFLPVLLVRLLSPARVIVYCHFPDKLLATRTNVVRKLYRLPFDSLEGLAIACAHDTIVNSTFTSVACATVFPKWLKATPAVLHPSLKGSEAPSTAANYQKQALHLQPHMRLSQIRTTCNFFLSVNRFERKKRLHVAIKSFSSFREQLRLVRGQQPLLIIAGGYDDCVAENVQHLQELRRLAKSLGVDRDILFLPSVSESMKNFLLERCTALLYTPVNEHFGITPLEALKFGRPVIACDSGGPCETIVHEKTGFLVDGTVEGFMTAMLECIVRESTATKIGSAGESRVYALFGPERFRTKLESILDQ